LGNLAGAFSTSHPGGTEAFRDWQHFEQFFRRHWTQDTSKAAEFTPAPAEAIS
jgi:hypothetical protein